MSYLRYLTPCPFCNADSNTFEDRGGSFGGPLNQRWYVCVTCDASIHELYVAFDTLLTFVHRDVVQVDESGDKTYPTAWRTWVNRVVLPAFRDRQERRREHEDREWVQWLAEVFYPAFPELKGSIPEGLEKSPFTDSTISYPRCPPEAKALFDRYFPDGRRAGLYLPFPEELETPVYPPGMPEMPGVVVFYQVALVPDFNRTGKEWVRIDPAISQALPIIEDPILAKNRKFFADVWEALALDVPIEEVRNEYGGIEPWYSFQVSGRRVTAGWRKRVVNLRVEFSEPRPVTALAELAKEDRTTFSASPEGVVTIHAWRKEKTIEYLRLLLAE